MAGVSKGRVSSVYERRRTAIWRLARRALLVGYLVAAAVGGALHLVPEPEPEPLIRASGWLRSPSFEPQAEERQGRGLRAALRDHPEARFWAVRPNARGPRRVIRTVPFAPRERMIVPYQLGEAAFGAIGSRYAAVRFKCVDSGEILRVDLRPTGVFVSELLVEPEPGFCSSDIVMEAFTSKRDRFIVGTPFSAGAIDELERGVLAQVPRHAAAFSMLCLIGLAGCLVTARQCDSSRLVIVFVVTPLILGLLSFFVYWALPLAGVAMAVVVLAGAAGICGWTWRRDREHLLRVVEPLRDAALVWMVVSLFFVCVLYAVDPGAGAWNANIRFWPARWSMDNHLPMMVGEAVGEGQQIEGILARWHVSDRPPLQTGVVLLLRPFARVLMAIENEVDVQHLYTVVGVILNCLWAYAGFLLARDLSLSRRSSLAVIVVSALTPFAVFNSCFVWPKMLSAALALLAVLLVARPALERDRRGVGAALGWVAMLSALSLLSHGSTVFFLLGLGLWLVLRVGWPGWRPVAMGLVIGLALLGPWMAWQKLVDPPGNALVKSSLAGTRGLGEEHIGVLETVIREHRAHGLDGWIARKRSGLKQILIGGDPSTRTRDLLAKRRWDDLFFLVPCLAPFFVLAVGVLVEPRPHARGSGKHERLARVCRSLVLIALLGLGISFMVQWKTHVIHHNPYGAIALLVLAATIGGVLSLGRFGALLVTLSVLPTLIVWIVDPLRGFQRIDPFGLAMTSALLGLGLLVLGLEARRQCFGSGLEVDPVDQAASSSTSLVGAGRKL